MSVTLELKVRLRQGGEIAMGPGKAELLEAIAAAGSISAAARQMGMSYRRAWLLVDVMNRSFDAPLVRSATGGQRGGGASVTAAGLQVLAQFRAMEQAAAAAAAPYLEALRAQQAMRE